jgi:phosphotriesterase-related protein
MAEVRTVTGSVDSADLGVTLFHEHLLNNGRSAWRRPDDADAEGWLIADAPVRMEYLGRLRNDPYLSLDNTSLDDLDLAVEEVVRFVGAGGGTIVEQSLDGIGRDPRGLQRIAEQTGVHVVMGCGYYLERAHPPGLAAMDIDRIAESIVQDVTRGTHGIRAGIIGEIGVSVDFTPAEERVLRAAARAQRQTGVPLSVHLPGWLRYGPRVLDVIEEEGGILDATVLAHMNPSHADREYQRALADRGAWIEYDMLGMEFFYPGEGQSPSDEDNASAIAQLLADGYGHRLLLSHDVFIKTLLCHYGGFGYAHVLTGFAAGLERHGVARERLMELLTTNPRTVFDTAWERRS